MQNSKKLEEVLRLNLDDNNYIVTAKSLYAVFPELTEVNINQLLCRAEKTNLLEHACKGVYIYNRVKYDPSLMLFKIANVVRFSECKYVSLETALSYTSVISQQLLNYLTIVTSGRSGIIDCSRFGKIEFVHSDSIDFKSGYVRYDEITGHFWASENLAMQDMKKHRRKLLSLTEK